MNKIVLSMLCCFPTALWAAHTYEIHEPTKIVKRQARHFMYLNHTNARLLEEIKANKEFYRSIFIEHIESLKEQSNDHTAAKDGLLVNGIVSGIMGAANGFVVAAIIAEGSEDTSMPLSSRPLPPAKTLCLGAFALLTFACVHQGAKKIYSFFNYAQMINDKIQRDQKMLELLD